MGKPVSCFQGGSLFSTPENTGYAKSRKTAAKSVLNSVQEMSDAVDSYSKSLRSAGSSLVMFHDSSKDSVPGAGVDTPAGTTADVADEYAKQLNSGFLEAASLSNGLVEFLAVGSAGVKRQAVLAVHSAGGAPESLGVTLQKLVNGERKLLADTKVLERGRSKLPKGGKGSAQAVQGDNGGAEAKLKAPVVSTLMELEGARGEVLLPQVKRLISNLADFWQRSATVFTKMQSDVTQVSATAESATSAGVGSSNKFEHEKTRDVGISFQKLHVALRTLAISQRKFCVTLVHWLAVILDMPEHFPRSVVGTTPTGGEVATQPAVSSKDHLFFGIVGEWMGALSRLPEGEFADSVTEFCRGLESAYEMQNKGMNLRKRVDASEKQLHKAEVKLQTLQHEEHDLQLQLESVQTTPNHERDEEVQRKKLSSTSKKVASGTTEVEVARKKLQEDRDALGVVHGGMKGMEAASLSTALPTVLRQMTAYAEGAARSWGMIVNEKVVG